MLEAHTATPADVDRLRAMVVARLGLQVGEERTGALAELLERRSIARRVGPRDYLRLLEGERNRDELQAVADALVVSETYFFRHREQFEALTQVAIPDRVRARASTRVLRILSLGCASGEEAYSLAITARAAVADPRWDVDVVGVDVNAPALEKARAGRYSAWSLRATPATAVDRWFGRSGNVFVLDRSIRNAVRFEHGNLADVHAPWAQPNSWDIVFLRNVIMYFSAAQAEALVRRVEGALAPGGYLFLGHAETLRGVSRECALRHTHGTFYYQREPGAGTAAAVQSVDGRSGSAEREPQRDRVDAIRTASDRVVAIVPEDVSQSDLVDAGHLHGDLRRTVRDLMEREEFSTALSMLDAVPGADGDAELRLIRGVLLVQQGRFDQAMDIARALLLRDPAHAAPRHLLALSLEGAGEPDAARSHWRLCVHLEPASGLARLHLGRLERRAGRGEAARRELAAARVLLPAESDSHVLLFGGGFSRAALLELCQAELVRAGCRA